jgi:hypothetical protein
MKSILSVSCIRIIPFLAVLFIAGCADNVLDLPVVFGGNEVPSDVMGAPRLVTGPSSENAGTPGWPRVGDVPKRPKNFTPQPMIDQSKQELIDDRKGGEAIRDDFYTTHGLDSPAAGNAQ